jgi:serine/threonine protein kinase
MAAAVAPASAVHIPLPPANYTPPANLAGCSSWILGWSVQLPGVQGDGTVNGRVPLIVVVLFAMNVATAAGLLLYIVFARRLARAGFRIASSLLLVPAYARMLVLACMFSLIYALSSLALAFADARSDDHIYIAAFAVLFASIHAVAEGTLLFLARRTFGTRSMVTALFSASAFAAAAAAAWCVVAFNTISDYVPVILFAPWKAQFVIGQAAVPMALIAIIVGRNLLPAWFRNFLLVASIQPRPAFRFLGIYVFAMYASYLWQGITEATYTHDCGVSHIVQAVMVAAFPVVIHVALSRDLQFVCLLDDYSHRVFFPGLARAPSKLAKSGGGGRPPKSPSFGASSRSRHSADVDATQNSINSLDGASASVGHGASSHSGGAAVGRNILRMMQRRAMTTPLDFRFLTIDRRIAEGASGVVWLGDYQGLGAVAVKEFHMPDMDRLQVLKCLRETRLLSLLQHRNVIRFRGVCVVPPSIFLLTDYYERGNLYDYLRSHPSLPMVQLVGMACDIARGITYLHTLKPPVMWRDCKTTNMLLDKDGSIILADLGDSRLYAAEVDASSSDDEGVVDASAVLSEDDTTDSGSPEGDGEPSSREGTTDSGRARRIATPDTHDQETASRQDAEVLSNGDDELHTRERELRPLSSLKPQRDRGGVRDHRSRLLSLPSHHHQHRATADSSTAAARAAKATPDGATPECVEVSASGLNERVPLLRTWASPTERVTRAESTAAASGAAVNMPTGVETLLPKESFVLLVTKGVGSTRYGAPEGV